MARTARMRRRKRKAGDSGERKGGEKGRSGRRWLAAAYSMELFGRDSKWTRRFADGCFDTALAQAYKLYGNIKKHAGVKTRRSHHQFVVCAIQGLLNDNKLDLLAPVTRSQVTVRPEDPVGTKAMSDVVSAASKSSAASKRSLAIEDNEEYMHWRGKTTGLELNQRQMRLQEALKTAQSRAERDLIFHKIAHMSKFMRKTCVQCRNKNRKTTFGCMICGLPLHEDPTCYNEWHRRVARGEVALKKNEFRSTQHRPPRASKFVQKHKAQPPVPAQTVRSGAQPSSPMTDSVHTENIEKAALRSKN